MSKVMMAGFFALNYGGFHRDLTPSSRISAWSAVVLFSAAIRSFLHAGNSSITLVHSGTGGNQT
jgi:hypothetical protein